MGRKGGGKAAFMKAARRPGTADSDKDIEPSTGPQGPVPAPAAPKPVEAPLHQPEISEKAAAFLADAPSDGNSDSDGGSGGDRTAGGETRGQLLQRHKREVKALKDKTKKLGKKGKDEAAALEADMERRHAEELASLRSAPLLTAEAAVAAADSLYAVSLNESAAGKKAQQPTKAQKKRQQRAQEEAEREARIAAEREAMGETEREAEEQALKDTLRPLGLEMRDIPPDGHCLYRSLEDQLRSLSDRGASVLPSDAGGEGPTYLRLRRLAATRLRADADHFRHFVDASDVDGAADAHENGDEDPFAAYCDRVESTAAWGGHLEVEALARELRINVRVHCAGAPVVEVAGDGKEGAGGEVPMLQVCYLKHAYGLGEHYNSVGPATVGIEDSKAEGEDAG
jgi:OTU domain-containing protein 6